MSGKVTEFARAAQPEINDIMSDARIFNDKWMISFIATRASLPSISSIATRASATTHK